jgi:hypothetical protein
VQRYLCGDYRVSEEERRVQGRFAGERLVIVGL